MKGTGLAGPASSPPNFWRALLGFSLSGLLLPGLVVAGESAQGGGPGNGPLNGPADAAVSLLDGVTVTARRREEGAQRVPMSLSVLGGADLADGGVDTALDLPGRLPGLNLSYLHDRSVSLAIRGIGNNPPNEGLESSVGVYLDNVFLGRPGMAMQGLLDLDRVELLRGPQGTLYGKNTTAGVLALTTRLPTFTPEGEVALSAGNRGYHQVQAMFSGPLGETLAGRIALYQTHDNGWISNLATGEKLDSVGRQGMRGQLLFAPHGDFSLRLIADYHEENDSQGTPLLYSLGPAAKAYRNLQTAAALAGAAPLPTDPSRYEVSLDSAQRVRARQGGFSAEANWGLAGNFQLTAITAWRNWFFDPHNDLDGTSAPMITDMGYQVSDRQFSQEIRLASPRGEAMDYVLGAFLFDQSVDNTLRLTAGSQADRLLLPAVLPAGLNVFNGATSLSQGHAETRSLALFGQGTWHLTDRLDAQVGLRLTQEHKTAWVNRLAPTGTSTLPAFLDALRQGEIGPWSSGPLSLDRLSPATQLGLAYRLTPSALLYGSLAQGDKSGGFNINGVGSGPSLGANSLAVGAERARTLDLGLKSSLWQDQLQVNINAFLARVTGYQTVASVYPAGSLLPYQVLANVGAVRSRGVEWDLVLRPRAGVAQGLQLRFNGAYTDARYQSFPNAPCPGELNPGAPPYCDLSGQPVQGAPRWMVNLGGRYQWSAGDRRYQYATLQYRWRSEAYGSLDNSRYNLLPAYGLVDAALGWQFPGGMGAGQGGSTLWDFSLWVRNLADTRYYLSGGQGAGGSYVAAAGTPRTLGMTLRYSF